MAKTLDRVRSILNFDSEQRQAERLKIRGEDHTYRRIDDKISAPCPCLNALTNQGYLPRDGKELTIPRIEAALMEALHMSGALAHTLASGLKPLIRKDGTLDLVDTRTHNVMEHDRSPTRLDTRQGDNWTMQPAMLDAMLADAGGGPMTVKSMAKTLARRKREHVASGGEPMPAKIVITNLLMTVSFINVEQSGAPTPENVRQFWTEERFQDYILNNPVQRTLHGLLWRVGLLLWYLLLG